MYKRSFAQVLCLYSVSLVVFYKLSQKKMIPLKDHLLGLFN